MPPTDDELAALFNQGEFSKLATTYTNSSSIPSAQRLLIANALVFTGELDSAKALALAEQRSTADTAKRAYAESILGLICWRRAHATNALQHFQNSVRLANDTKDFDRIAWNQLHFFRFAIDCQPIDVALSILPEARRATIRAGNVHATAYLHCCVSVLEGQIGRFDESRRHCDIAERLLDNSANSWIRINILINRACIACFRCEFTAASTCIKAAYALIEKSGNAQSRFIADSTSSYLDLVTGNFERAGSALVRLVNEREIHRLSQLSSLDTLARVHLALNDLEKCEQSLERLWAGDPSSTVEAKSYNTRWAGVTKARLLARQGRLTEAITWIVSLREKARADRDTPFNAALNALVATFHHRTGRPSEAARSIFASDRSGITEFHDWHSQFCFAAGALLEDRAPEVSNQLKLRALRLWASQGAISPFLEMSDRAIDVNTARQELKAAKAGPAPVPRTPAAVTNTIAAVIDLAYSPRLLGVELIALLRALQCAPDARLVETRTSEPEATVDVVTFPLGQLDKRKLTLVCQAPSDPGRAVLLGDVLRIARAALDLEQARRAERNRAALWPASTVEEQAGAFYLAEEMQALLTTARRIATTNVPVLITGETGTGKEILARTIHGYSPRAAKPFLPYNCTATPRDMLDAQLFGHRRGAFTGATEHSSGVIRAAAGGTLFLDEIGEMTLDIQPKLLRFLEAGEVHPIGDTQPTRVDVRVIAATNADLDTLLSQGRFREDLFYRLNIVRLHVPPLRERRVEIPVLANYYLDKHARECGKHSMRLAEETMDYLLLYRWPGNVRQLANEMRRMAVLAEQGAALMPEHLSPAIAASRRTIPASERTLEPAEVVVRLDQPMAAAVQHLEQSMIQYAMKKCEGRVEETATLLGLSRKGLYLKRQRFGISFPEPSIEAI